MKRPHVLLALPQIVLCQLASTPAIAKRVPAPHVDPVVSGHVRYVAPNLYGEVGYVQAWDVNTGKLLWQIVVYKIKINPRREQDVQWRFITRLQIVPGSLLVTNESGSRYAVNLQTRKVKRVV